MSLNISYIDNIEAQLSSFETENCIIIRNVDGMSIKFDETDLIDGKLFTTYSFRVWQKKEIIDEMEILLQKYGRIPMDAFGPFLLNLKQKNEQSIKKMTAVRNLRKQFIPMEDIKK